jgi:tripartite-type tricarboxylate transporter receptor subunit TctC
MDYKPGASGLIAEEFVARSAPDGQILLIDHSVLAMNPVVNKGAMRFSVQNDLKPVIALLRYQHVLIAAPNLGVKSVSELAALGKAKPGGLNYASAGSGSPQHAMAEQFLRNSGIRGTHVPYKGGAAMLMSVASGDVQFAFIAVPSGIELIKGDKVRALAVLDEKRSRALPAVPTMAELGYGSMQSPWIGILAARGTPDAIVQSLNQAYAKVLADPQTIEWMAAESLQPIGGTSSDFAKTILAEIEGNVRVAKELGLTAD